MDSRKVQTPHGHQNAEHPHNSHNVGTQGVVTHGEEHNHHDHEKKSVLTKVKQKAKKIKNSITKHGHHDQEHGHEYHYEDQHIPDDHDLDEEGEVDEDPEIHGAPIYDSEAVRGAAPGKVNTIGRPGVNFGGTTVLVEEPHHEARVLGVVVVSPTTGINQIRSNPTTTFVEVEKIVHLKEDPHAPRSTSQAYSPANYQTKVTDPTGEGGAEIDITPVEKSFSRMSVHNEPKPYPEPKLFPTVHETHHPSVGSHSQFAPEISTATTNYPSAQSHGHYMPELSSEVKSQYRKSHNQFTPELSTPTKTPNPSPKIHDQNLSQKSSATTTQYPLSGNREIHDQHLPLPQKSSATKTQYPLSGNRDQFTPESELSTPTKTHHASTKIHDQHLPLPQQSSARKFQYPLSGNHDHDQFTPVLSTEPNIQYPSTKIHDQHLPLSTEPHIQYPSTKIHDQQHLPQHSSARATNTHYPSTGSHDQFLPEFSTQPKTTLISKNTTQVGEPHYEPMETPSNESSYTDKMSSATTAIADKAITAKNAVASKLGYGDDRTNTETTQTKHQEEYTGNEQPSTISAATSAITDKAITAKNTVASKLGYGPDTETTQSRVHQENTGYEKPSAISSIADKAVTAKNIVTSKLGYVDNTETTQISHQNVNTGSEQPSTISLATAAVADKAVSAKNTVASKLGYGANTETTQSRDHHQENTGYEKPSATSGIADKAVSAKNTVASKLGFGDTTTTTHEEKRSEHAAAPTEYGKSVSQSLTEKVAPVYGAKSKFSGTETSPVGVEQDKGVSVKDYLVDKLRPSVEDRALSEVISETLHKKESPVEVTEEGVRKLVSDAVHKREDEPERRMEKENRRILARVTESEEVKRRLGGEDVKTEERYQEIYVNSPGKGVVDKLKGMVGTLFTNPAENQASQGSPEVEHVNQGAGERRLQESSN